MIWKYTCFHQRNIDITASYLPDQLWDIWDESYFDDVFYYLSLCSPPAVLHVNKESRSEGLKWYSLDFGTKPTSSDPIYASPDHIYINWQVDRICVLNWGRLRQWHGDASQNFRERCTRNKLHFLACNLSEGLRYERIEEIIPRGLELEELALFSSRKMFYEKPHHLCLRLEDRKMNQMGAFKDMIDAAVADRKRRESELASASGDLSTESDQAASTLHVKLVRVLN
jgi:2EXR family